MLRFFHAFLMRYGLLGSFTLLFMENLGIPLPTEAAYVLAESLIIRGTYSYFTVSIVFLAAHLLGSIVSYGIAREITVSVHAREKDIKKRGGVQAKIAGWYRKHGVLAVFVTKLIGQVRPWSSYVAGAAEMDFWPFVGATILGTIVLNALSLALTKVAFRYSAHHHWFAIISEILFAAGVIVVVYLEARVILQERKEKK